MKAKPSKEVKAKKAKAAPKKGIVTNKVAPKKAAAKKTTAKAESVSAAKYSGPGADVCQLLDAAEYIRVKYKVRPAGVRLMAQLVNSGNNPIALSDTGEPSWSSIIGQTADKRLFKTVREPRGDGLRGWQSIIRLTPFGLKAAAKLKSAEVKSAD